MKILEQFRLDGKTALVTGDRRGIGMAMAVGLAEAGADIIGVSATLEPSGSAVEKAVTALGRDFKAYTCDFADREALYAFIAAVKQDYPVVDILVNNAGTILRKPAAEHPDEYWDTILEVNLTAQFILAREFGKEMVTRGKGKIIFTASLLTFQGGWRWCTPSARCCPRPPAAITGTAGAWVYLPAKHAQIQRRRVIRQFQFQ